MKFRVGKREVYMSEKVGYILQVRGDLGLHALILSMITNMHLLLSSTSHLVSHFLPWHVYQLFSKSIMGNNLTIMKNNLGDH